MSIKRTVISLLSISLLISCKHDIPSTPGTGTDVCFESDVLPLFQSNCAQSGCHDATSRQEGYQLDTYANIVARGVRPGNAAESKIYEVLLEDGDDRMPPPPNPRLTSEQIGKIADWINQGARNTTGCAPPCDSTNITYSGKVRSILQTHCLGCHTGSTAAGGFIPLETYQAVKDQVDFGALPAVIEHATGYSPMPKNSAKLSDCKITVIRKWIEAGAPNN